MTFAIYIIILSAPFDFEKKNTSSQTVSDNTYATKNNTFKFNEDSFRQLLKNRYC